MRLHNIGYLIKEGARNIFSNKLMSFACIGVLVACFLLIGGAVLLSLSVNNMVEYVENQNEIVAFLDDDVSATQASAIGRTLEEMDNIGEVIFVSKEEALEEEKAQAEEYGDIFEGLEDDNPLPDKYIIQIESIDALSGTIEAVEATDGVQKVLAQTDVARILAGVKKAVNYAGTAIVLILVLVSMIIITNTIKLTVFSRRKEINIMKYVGATDSFIRMPYLVEGMLIGLLAAILAFALLGGGYTYLLSWANQHYGSQLGIVLESAVTFGEAGVMLFVGFALIGVLIGMTGSMLFVRKYLRV